uniref:Uncharacterized protein n=1 Tax=Rhizophagus irregularis (strain DAOM 181602 / DAOM 197198 / MUCL 43194) TaxID=747089 RepID=U9SKX9_RHIID
MTYGRPSIGAKIIQNLLQAKYLQQYIHSKTLYNSIQECKPLIPTVLQHNAINLLNLLREYQIKNPECNLEKYINLQSEINNTTKGYLEEMYKKLQINLKTLLEIWNM